VQRKTIPQPPRFWLIVISAAIASLYLFFMAGNVVVMTAMHAATHAQVMTATSELPQLDFARFWFVGKSLDMRGTMPSAWFEKSFRINILSSASGTLVWLYPPTMNLVAMVFAQLPLTLGFWVWRVVCWSIAGFLLRLAGMPWIVIVAGVLSPAGLHDTLDGQNGTLTGALAVSALMLIDRHPRLGGTVAGILCIKPQAALILPLIVLQKRRMAFCACAVTVLALVGLSLLIEGINPWIWFLTVAQPASRRILQTPYSEDFPATGFTVFMMARSLHASLGYAWLIQALCSAAASILVWQLWRRKNCHLVARVAATLSLAVLITPYGFTYDLTGFSIVMAAMLWQAPARIKPVFALLWLASGYTEIVAYLTGLLLFPIAAVIAAALSWYLIEPAAIRLPGTRLPRRDADPARAGAIR
jgi:hypothetical protein